MAVTALNLGAVSLLSIPILVFLLIIIVSIILRFKKHINLQGQTIFFKESQAAFRVSLIGLILFVFLVLFNSFFWYLNFFKPESIAESGTLLTGAAFIYYLIVSYLLIIATIFLSFVYSDKDRNRLFQKIRIVLIIFLLIVIAFSPSYLYYQYKKEQSEILNSVQKRFPGLETKYLQKKLYRIKENNYTLSLDDSSNYPCLDKIEVNNSRLFYSTLESYQKGKNCPVYEDQVRLKVLLLANETIFLNGVLDIFPEGFASVEIIDVDNKRQLLLPLLKGRYKISYSYGEMDYGQQIIDLQKDSEITINIR